MAGFRYYIRTIRGYKERAIGKASKELLYHPQGTPKLSFFLLSSGRSGSTLLRRMLCMHPSIEIPPESGIAIPEAASTFIRNRKRSWEELADRTIDVFFSKEALDAWDLDPSRVKEAVKALPEGSRNFQGILDTVYKNYAEPAGSESVEIYGDKTPILFLWMKWLKLLYPNALYVFVIRDGRDVVNSMVHRRGLGLTEACDRWLLAMKMMERYKKDEELNACFISYERMVKEPQQTLSGLFDRLGVEDRSEEPRFFEGISYELGDTVLPHHTKAKRKVDARNIGLWKKELGKEDRRIMGEKLDATLKKWGYSSD
ncbi:MAG: sulfotransferase [Flavobacteriales bacterium]